MEVSPRGLLGPTLLVFEGDFPGEKADFYEPPTLSGSGEPRIYFDLGSRRYYGFLSEVQFPSGFAIDFCAIANVDSLRRLSITGG